MKNFKLSTSAIILSIFLNSNLQCFAMEKNSFDHFESYQIRKLHEKNIKGSGYRIGIFENYVLETHPALNGKIEIVDKDYHTQLTDNELLYQKLTQNDSQDKHGNHVSALIVGNEVDKFPGGIAPNAIGCIMKRKNGVDDIKSFFESSQNTHILNYSGALVSAKINNKGTYDGLSASEKNVLKDTLIKNDAILIITGANIYSHISKKGSLSYLMDL